MRALVMGGNRYIGLHLVFELARRGHDVTVMNSHEAPMPQGATRLHGDRQVPGTIEKVLAGRDFDVIFDNTSYQVKDVKPLVELFGDRQYVFTSSVAVYKRSFLQPVLETHPAHSPDDPDPRKAYGVGKVNCENYVLPLGATSLRVTHTIGPKSPLPREHAFFKRLEEGRPILIPGEGFPFVHLVHVQDVANLMCSVIGNDKARGQIYNVAGREYASVLGCIELMGRVVGVKPEVVHVPMEVARRARPPLLHWGESLLGGSVISIDKALADLDWEPSFGLEAAYRHAYQWFSYGGREQYEFDFSSDDEILAQI
jgi:nucleoside-diphosphate-sugar epimerase